MTADTSITLPIAPVERIIRAAGISRISEEATNILIDYAIEQIQALATSAYTYTTHAGRNTLKAVDIEAALGNL